MAFLGSIGADRFDAVGESAARVQAPAFDLVIDEARYWKQNSIVWAGPRGVPDALSTLVSALRAELTGAGAAFDPKPFVPHVTLLRDARRPAAMPLLEPVAWPVRSFCLVRSSGGRYDVLREWPLRG